MGSDHPPESNEMKPDGRPFVIPCHDLTFAAPWRWLRLGWADVRRAPALSFLFGLIIVLISAAISWLAWSLGRFALLATLLSGFVYIAPLIGVGLYSVSRGLLAGQVPKLGDSFVIARRVAGHAGIFALIQLVIILIWSRSGMMLTAFVPVQTGDTRALVEFLLIGSAVGSIFAAITFAVTAFSLPMIADRDIDMVTACISSINAVLRNKWVLAEWAAIICLLTALGFATALIGLGLVMPWLAYATFHAYRDTIDASAWPIA
ncbi:MAG: DUF2189 domain-containing protein [Rhodanobacteraceae bacterium]|mgnify:CR=1 FL=1|nr:DUF2189 domain-containing protein [Rhodanobacteraceae bacterium]MBK7042508.1 DUF2189 domain-containing protein [Rhodanobacteraceae bacterium]MBP9154763.1 DUF2189 domain-containing protein [Xanthomonadales bacterium]HQW82263.1 DUF2189 domain-containing protein [Pseudomonadota bacterium]